MSRVARAIIIIPTGVQVDINNQTVLVKSVNGELSRLIHSSVCVRHVDNYLTVMLSDKVCSNAKALAGTTRSLLNSMIIGVTQGFVKKLQLIGIGYRVTLKDYNVVSISVGFSHSIDYKLPVGISAQCSSNQTEITLIGMDKQIIGQVAADLRSFRPPEPFKGKGIRYVNEVVYIKEVKKR